MASTTFSREERSFVAGGVQVDLRIDGRSCTDYRNFNVKYGIVTSANGSAEVKLGKTHVIVGIKAELGEPEGATPNIGIANFFVDCSANASPAFEGRGGSDLALELRNGLSQIMNTRTFDYKSLCIVPGKYCWILYIDSIVLECDGNLFDALSLAVKAALNDTLIPKLVISGDSDDIDIDISDDQYDIQSLDISNVPVMVTVNKVENRFVLDALPEEESCIDAMLLVSVDRYGEICGLQKFGSGGLDPELTFEMIQVAKEAGKSLNKNLEKTFKKDESMSTG
ncbi:exosome complex component RRP42-like [Rhopilema esculentum]|uniref:exosome complex component RRP42-like n=1 Tax=Rhopilema esculentum TaxID=499914 RepID=UPI0031D01EFA